jgi:FlaA1/EpsC-like NDP-sugar epimerase
MNVENLLGRSGSLFKADLALLDDNLSAEIARSKILVIGGAGSIGRAVSLEIFKRNPKALHVVDISENNLVELVRYIRSSLGYSEGEFKTFAIDCGGAEFEVFFNAEGPYDYIFNLSALKHVRSEKDPFTLMRMIQVNIFNTLKTLDLAKNTQLKKYFCVSTDKAANPVNMMGASKRIMEKFLMSERVSQSTSLARFANVAFSDGSLLHGFTQRLLNQQPLSAPADIMRYFISPMESGQLCLLSGICGNDRDILVPKTTPEFQLEKFSDIAIRFLEQSGFEPVVCTSEDEARYKVKELMNDKKWPVYFFNSDTTGEKPFEEFYTDKEDLDEDYFKSLNVIKNKPQNLGSELQQFEAEIAKLTGQKSWSKSDLLYLFNMVLPDFYHKETGTNLDNRM